LSNRIPPYPAISVFPQAELVNIFILPYSRIELSEKLCKAEFMATELSGMKHLHSSHKKTYMICSLPMNSLFLTKFAIFCPEGYQSRFEPKWLATVNLADAEWKKN
jgi:hypothetical protein